MMFTPKYVFWTIVAIGGLWFFSLLFPFQPEREMQLVDLKRPSAETGRMWDMRSVTVGVAPQWFDELEGRARTAYYLGLVRDSAFFFTLLCVIYYGLVAPPPKEQPDEPGSQ